MWVERYERSEWPVRELAGIETGELTPDGLRRAAKVGGVARDTGWLAPCR
jgi:hypothetical protein